MPDIKYVAFSDLHLGAENSLLTHLVDGTVDTDPSVPSDVMKNMAACLHHLVRKNKSADKVKVILNGDLIELALSSTNTAAMAFQRFVELLFPENEDSPFDPELLFIAGNHDHNTWEGARKGWYIDYLANIQPHDFINNDRHTTRMINPENVQSHFLTYLANHSSKVDGITVKCAYPAYAIVHPQEDKAVVFCHAHYVESMYSLMTHLRSMIFPDRAAPTTFEELETENYAWVDFFWSTLGRSGTVGQDINLIYDKLQDAKAVDQMIDNIAKSISKNTNNRIKKWLENKALHIILQLTLGHMAASERNEPDVVLTPDATQGLKNLLETYLYNQFRNELGGHVPASMSFIFGHTHKPFVRTETYKGFANPVKIFNSGGWVVDTLNTQPLHGGSIVLIDEHFDAVSLEMYREGNYEVQLGILPDTDGTHCDFSKYMMQEIDNQQEPWKSFNAAVKKGVDTRHKNLATIIKS